MVTTTSWTDADTKRALAVWEAYQGRHDMSPHVGRVAGIDAETGRVWIGATAIDVVQAAKAEGVDRPLLRLRVGYDYWDNGTKSVEEAVWTPADTERAKAFWTDYQLNHDLSDRRGQAAGIDPETGEVFFGNSAADISRQLSAKGRQRLLFFVRVGSESYARKVGKRCSREK